METAGTAKRHWWRKRRWWAVAFTAVLLFAYPLSFLLACWTLLRINPVEHPHKWNAIVAFYRPAAELLKASPVPVRHFVNRAASLGKPDYTGLSITPSAVMLVTQDPASRPRPVIIAFVVW